MRNIITVSWSFFRDRRLSLAVYSFFVLLFDWMYIAMYPSIQGQAEEFNELIANYPEGLWEALSIEEISFDSIERFLDIEQYSMVWPLMVIFLSLGIAGAALAGNIERGAMELVLTKPISRTRIFIARYMTGIISIAVFTSIAVLGVLPIAALYDIPTATENYFTLLWLALCFAWAIFSMGMMFSAMFSEKSKVYMATGGILFLMYIANVASALIEEIEFLEYISYFHYFDHASAFIYNTLEWESVLSLAGTAMLWTVIGILVFRKRDIPL